MIEKLPTRHPVHITNRAGAGDLTTVAVPGPRSGETLELLQHDGELLLTTDLPAEAVREVLCRVILAVTEGEG